MSIASRTKTNPKPGFKSWLIQKVFVVVGVCLLVFTVRGISDEIGFRNVFGFTVANSGADSGVDVIESYYPESVPAVFTGEAVGVYYDFESVHSLELSAPTHKQEISDADYGLFAASIILTDTKLVALPEVGLVEMPLIPEEARTPVQVSAVSSNSTASTIGMQGLTERERWEYEAVVWAESRGEGLYGMVKVAEVLRNRVNHSAFPDSLRGVINANNGTTWQFCVVRTGAYLNYPSNGDEDARRAVQMALDGSDLTNGATYFRQLKGYEGSWHQRNMHTVMVYGNHVFGQMN